MELFTRNSAVQVPTGAAFQRLILAETRLATSQSVFQQMVAKFEIVRARTHKVALATKFKAANPELYGLPTLSDRLAQVTHKVIK